MKLGAFQSFHGDVFLTPPPPPRPTRYLHHSQSSSLHFSVTTQYCQAYVRVSIGLTVSRKMNNEFSHQW